MTTTEIATTTNGELATTDRAAARTAIELTADQREFTPQQVAVLKQLGIDDAPAAQLDLFFHRCQTTGLDPFAKQIYLIGRKTKVGGYRGEPERWETRYTIQTGIDGYRLNGRRAAKAAGESVKTEGPFWMGPDGGDWSDVWLGGRGKPPAAAKFVVIADGEPHVGIALYSEFVQTKNNGEPNSMWDKMPGNQLAKCAEAQAWRKAYPDDFSGLVLEDAVQVIEPDGSASFVRADRVHRSAAAVFAAQEPAAVEAAVEATVDEPAGEVLPAEEPAPAEAEAQAEPLASRVQLDRVAALFEEVGLTKRADKYEYLSLKLGRKITGANQLTAAEADLIVEALVEVNSGPPADTVDAPADETAGGAQ